MSLTQYYSTGEINRDHERKCDKCGKNYSVVWRIFGTGSDSASNSLLSQFTNAHNRAADKASQYAQQIVLDKAIKQTVFWHRCTKCGYYSNSDLEMIRKSLKGFRRQRRPIRFICWLIGLMLFPLGVLMFIVLIVDLLEGKLAAPSGNEPSFMILMIFALLALLAGGLMLWFGWWISSKRRFDKNLRTLNSENRTIAWLERWNSKGVTRVENLKNETITSLHEQNSVLLQREQFGKDLVSPHFARTSDYKK